MCYSYSTNILAQKSEQLLFSIKSDAYLYHCWMNIIENKFVIIKETNDSSKATPVQLLNFTERTLKKYLYTSTEKLKRIDGFLFFNDELWNKYISAA
ncbi:MAG: hypothetical protein U0U67_02970 [Chitinophagales bacterium]